MATKTINCTRQARQYEPAGSQVYSNGNWGLIRHTSNANPFTSLSYYQQAGSAFTYTYDDTNGQGENVDMVFITSGMIYTDNAGYKTSGTSRIQQFDWRTLTDSPTSVNVDYSTSAARSSHSEAVVACACHNDYGAATAANIYIIPRNQITNSTHWWTLPKLFHQQKGNSNPTIVVNSFGGTTSIAFVQNILFRGNTYRTMNGGNPFHKDATSGRLAGTGFFVEQDPRLPRTTEDALIEEMTDAGVIHFMSAGNAAHKIDVSGGIDYDNKFLRYTNAQFTFLNRGSYVNEDSIMVGNLNSWFNDGNTTVSDVSQQMKEVCPFPGELIFPSSNRGPRVDCYVAGTAIPLVIPNTSNHTTNSNASATGTSYSCPTLAGLAAMVASKYPTTTSAQMRKYLREIAVSSATMGNPDTPPTVSNGDYGDPDYMNHWASQGSNLKITYIDPSLPYDPSGITDTTITYPKETLEAGTKKDTRSQTSSTY
jgi:hypothetical protein